VVPEGFIFGGAESGSRRDYKKIKEEIYLLDSGTWIFSMKV
jgi:hypothetical protein